MQINQTQVLSYPKNFEKNRMLLIQLSIQHYRKADQKQRLKSLLNDSIQSDFIDQLFFDNFQVIKASKTFLEDMILKLDRSELKKETYLKHLRECLSYEETDKFFYYEEIAQISKQLDSSQKLKILNEAKSYIKKRVLRILDQEDVEHEKHKQVLKHFRQLHKKMGLNDLESTINLCKKELKSDNKIGLNSRRSWRLEKRKKIQDKKKLEEIERQETRIQELGKNNSQDQANQLQHCMEDSNLSFYAGDIQFVPLQLFYPFNCNSSMDEEY